jgi:hypothetical protein
MVVHIHLRVVTVPEEHGQTQASVIIAKPRLPGDELPVAWQVLETRASHEQEGLVHPTKLVGKNPRWLPKLEDSRTGPPNLDPCFAPSRIQCSCHCVRGSSVRQQDGMPSAWRCFTDMWSCSCGVESPCAHTSRRLLSSRSLMAQTNAHSSSHNGTNFGSGAAISLKPPTSGSISTTK